MKDQNEKTRLLRLVRDSMGEVQTRCSDMAGILTVHDKATLRAVRARHLSQLQVEMEEAVFTMAKPLRGLAAMGCMDDSTEETEEPLKQMGLEAIQDEDEGEDAS